MSPKETPVTSNAVFTFVVYHFCTNRAKKVYAGLLLCWLRNIQPCIFFEVLFNAVDVHHSLIPDSVWYFANIQNVVFGQNRQQQQQRLFIPQLEVEGLPKAKTDQEVEDRRKVVTELQDDNHMTTGRLRDKNTGVTHGQWFRESQESFFLFRWDWAYKTEVSC